MFLSWIPGSEDLSTRGIVVHPFDLKAAIFARHAQQVVLIHFPIALFIAGVGFDYAGQLSRKPTLNFRRLLQLAGRGVLGDSAVATGLLAWQLQFDGRMLHGILLLHLLLGDLRDSNLAGLVASFSRDARKSPAAILSFAAGSISSNDRCSNGTSRRVPERCQRATLNRARVGHSCPTISFPRPDR